MGISGFTFNREKHEMCEKKTTAKGRKGREGKKKNGEPKNPLTRGRQSTIFDPNLGVFAVLGNSVCSFFVSFRAFRG
jgi:hypothetical protein